jgi:glycosyltransferase involved in cell wall biosynthesis
LLPVAVCGWPDAENWHCYMNDSRHVVFVTPVFGAGETGPETYTRYLWESFQNDSQIEFHLVAADFPNPHPRWHASGRGTSSLDLYRRVAATALQVAREINSAGQPVLLHVNNSHLHTSLLGYEGPLWGQINDYENADLWHRAGETIRRAGWRRFASLWRRRRLEQKFISRQELSLCNSVFTREKILAEYHPGHPERVITLSKAVDVGFFSRPAQLPDDPANRPVAARRFVYVGSDIVRKGLDVLLRAVENLPGNLEWHLTVVGATREQAERAFPDLKARCANPRILFAGKVEKEQLRRLLWQSHVFVLPSRAEALGVALLEALAAGLPVVATQVGGIPEIVSDPAAGILVPADNPAALGKALAQIQPWPNGGLPLAVTKILESYSTQTMIARLRELYLRAS